MGEQNRLEECIRYFRQRKAAYQEAMIGEYLGGC